MPGRAARQTNQCSTTSAVDSGAVVAFSRPRRRMRIEDRAGGVDADERSFVTRVSRSVGHNCAMQQACLMMVTGV